MKRARVLEKEVGFPVVEGHSEPERGQENAPAKTEFSEIFSTPAADVELPRTAEGTTTRRASNTNTVSNLKKLIDSQKEDPLADLKYLNEMMAETAVFSPLMRAVLYKPGEGASSQERESAFRYLLKSAIETSVKLISLTTRGLKITEEEKRSAVKKSLPWVGELVANAWVVLPEGNSTLDLDAVLRGIRSSRPEVDKLLKKARVPDDFKIESADMAAVHIRTAISQALYPVVNMLSLYEDSPDPKQIGDLIESYKDYLVKDSVKFLDTLSSDQMKIGEATKLDALSSRLKQVSSLLTSDLQSYKALAGRNPSKEELLKNRLPRVRGLVYQIDTFVQSAIGGIKISRASDMDIPKEQIDELDVDVEQKPNDVINGSAEQQTDDAGGQQEPEAAEPTVKTKQQSRTFGATL